MEAERRQVVILFADLVGYTTLAERLGEEIAFGLIQGLSQTVERAVQAEGAHIRNIIGDGIMVPFGAPDASEDAPLRACRAALAIINGLESVWDEFEARHGLRPAARIGLNAGPAIFGHLQAGGDAGLAVLGDTVNLAARIQALAAPGTVVMSESTYRRVEGMVDAAFSGEHPIKGRAAAEKIFRLDRIRGDASRFSVSLSRGLTPFVGRERELEALVRRLDAIEAGVQTVDIVGEAGIGKTRLLHEFRVEAARGRALILAGFCTTDSRQTPFRAFMDVVRDAFRIGARDDGAVIEAKLDEGLRALALASNQNIGLLLNLLGREPNSGFKGMDGVLVGLRTRELLRGVLEARSRLAPLVLLVEDIHWADSASEALLASLVAIAGPLRLLILHTRRPDYAPPWGESVRVHRLALEPLSARETARIAQARLGVDQLPAALGRLIVAKAEGNALFAEEIVGLLVERGVVTGNAAGISFDAAAVSGALPEGVRAILASRVDQLPREARSLLQTAAVIGRRFDPDVVLALTEGRERQDASFALMEAADLIRRDEASGDYVFKHVLLREAVYDQLLSAPRAAMHHKVAEELERRSANALHENAERLAHHFAAGENAGKAFHYQALAARKSLNVYAIAEAEAYFRRALETYQKNPGCAEPLATARAVVGLLETLMLKSDYREAGKIAERFMPLVRQAGDTPELVTAFYYRTLSLVQGYDLRAGLALMTEAHEVADRLGDLRARAFARAGLLHCRTRLGLDTFEEAERRKAELMEDCLRLGDNFLRNSAYFFVTWDYLYRGLIKDARAIAIQLIASEEAREDPRAIGFANWILGWINVVGGSPEEAIGYADECLRVAIAPFDRLQAEIIKTVAAILSGSSREGLQRIEKLNAEFYRLGALYNVLESPRGVALIGVGRISEGIRVIEKAIVAREAAGDRAQAGFARILLAEVYIRILAGGRKTPIATVLKNLPALAAARARGARRASVLLDTAAVHAQFSRSGVAMARIDFDRAQLLTLRRRKPEARACLERARTLAEAQGLEGLRRQSETALARLS